MRGGRCRITCNPWWSYVYEGPIDADWPDMEADSSGLVRACFYRPNNLLVF